MKKFWFECKRFDLTKDAAEEPKCSLAAVPTEEETTSAEFRHGVMKTFNIPSDGTVVIKLRNHRGSLMPLCNRLPTSSKLNPYRLQVYRVNQSHEPSKLKSVKPMDIEVAKKVVQDLMHRLEVLESAVPELRERKTTKMGQEIENLEQKLKFLNKRIHQAESTKWEGMFKRNPLW